MFIMQGEEVKLVRHIISYVEHETEVQGAIDEIVAELKDLRQNTEWICF